MRPDLRPTDTQRESVRHELVAQVHAICDAWSEVERQAKEMSRGFPSGGEGSTGEDGSIVERVALSEAFDPATAASDWLTHLQEFRAHAKSLNGGLHRILPDRTTRGEVNNMVICSGCGLPAARVRRWKGEPFHDTTCYHKAARSA